MNHKFSSITKVVTHVTGSPYLDINVAKNYTTYATDKITVVKDQHTVAIITNCTGVTINLPQTRLTVEIRATTPFKIRN